MNEIIFNILRLINEDKYIEANKLIEEILKNNNSDKEFDENDLQYFASCLLACRRFDLAVLFFTKANNFSSAAFVEIIRGNLKEAQQLLHKKDESSVNSSSNSCGCENKDSNTSCKKSHSNSTQ